MTGKFRLLRADEIECRVNTVSENGCSLLLYKDARCDMNILDESVGPMNWMRTHSRENANCTVSIWDSEKQIWISKEDTGKESNTEAEKGLASDSFKRACVNWGIGRELYTSPFIWINSQNCKIAKNPKTNKPTCYDKFSVKSIQYDDRGNISGLSIWNENQKRDAYTYGMPDKKDNAKKVQYIDQKMQKALCAELDRVGKSLDGMMEYLKVRSLEEITEDQFKSLMNSFQRLQTKKIPESNDAENPFK